MTGNIYSRKIFILSLIFTISKCVSQSEKNETGPPNDSQSNKNETNLPKGEILCEEAHINPKFLVSIGWFFQPMCNFYMTGTIINSKLVLTDGQKALDRELTSFVLTFYVLQTYKIKMCNLKPCTCYNCSCPINRSIETYVHPSGKIALLLFEEDVGADFVRLPAEGPPRNIFEVCSTARSGGWAYTKTRLICTDVTLYGEQKFNLSYNYSLVNGIAGQIYREGAPLICHGVQFGIFIGGQTYAMIDQFVDYIKFYEKLASEAGGKIMVNCPLIFILLLFLMLV